MGLVKQTRQELRGFFVDLSIAFGGILHGRRLDGGPYSTMLLIDRTAVLVVECRTAYDDVPAGYPAIANPFGAHDCCCHTRPVVFLAAFEQLVFVD